MTAAAATDACNVIENQQYACCASSLGAFIFFGNHCAVKAFFPVLDADGQA
jgi:hypothetical protein